MIFDDFSHFRWQTVQSYSLKLVWWDWFVWRGEDVAISTLITGHVRWTRVCGDAQIVTLISLHTINFIIQQSITNYSSGAEYSYQWWHTAPGELIDKSSFVWYCSDDEEYVQIHSCCCLLLVNHWNIPKLIKSYLRTTTTGCEHVESNNCKLFTKFPDWLFQTVSNFCFNQLNQIPKFSQLNCKQTTLASFPRTLPLAIISIFATNSFKNYKSMDVRTFFYFSQCCQKATFVSLQSLTALICCPFARMSIMEDESHIMKVVRYCSFLCIFLTAWKWSWKIHKGKI